MCYWKQKMRENYIYNIMKQNILPMKKLTCIWYKEWLSINQMKANHPLSQGIPWHETFQKRMWYLE